MKSRPYFLLLPVFIFLASCEKDEVFELCSCKGSDFQSIENAGGVVALTRDGYKVISVDHGIVNSCEHLPINLQVDGLQVTFSGKYIPTCTKDFPGYGIVGSKIVEIGDIQPASNLYSAGNITIKIFQTSAGQTAGYGYEINHQTKNFNIIQDEIPAMGGTEPFETEEDARKIAFLVAYKLNTSDDFPSVYLGELYLLRVIHKQD
jgi:hypothetical protein